MPKGRGSNKRRNWKNHEKYLQGRKDRQPYGNIARLLKGIYKRGKGTMYISEIEMRKG